MFVLEGTQPTDRISVPVILARGLNDGQPALLVQAPTIAPDVAYGFAPNDPMDALFETLRVVPVADVLANLEGTRTFTYDQGDHLTGERVGAVVTEAECLQSVLTEAGATGLTFYVSVE